MRYMPENYIEGTTEKRQIGEHADNHSLFRRVTVDIIEPLFPTSKRGAKSIITMIDVATRYPQAIALSNIDT